MAYLIRPVTVADLPLLTRWRHQPHVRRWWGEPEVEDEVAAKICRAFGVTTSSKW